MFLAQTSDLVIPIGGGGLLALNAAFFAALLKGYSNRDRDRNDENVDLRRSMSEERRQFTNEVRELRKQVFVLEFKNNVLIWTLQENKIKVPEVIFSRNNTDAQEIEGST